MTEFDGVLTAPSYGFESRDQYYEQSCIHDKVKNIQVPFVCIMAMDDPFSPPDCKSNFVVYYNCLLLLKVYRLQILSQIQTLCYCLRVMVDISVSLKEYIQEIALGWIEFLANSLLP